MGSYIVEELLRCGHEPTLMVRSGSEKKVTQPGQVTIISGSLQDLGAIDKTLDGAEVVIYLVGIIREFPSTGMIFEELHFRSAKRVIDAAVKQGVKRFILMSALGVKPDGTDYQKTKFLAEQYLKNSGLDWTIFRPSLIFGDPRGKIEFCTQLKKDMLSLPLPAPAFFPRLNLRKAGQFFFSPIHVTDVARVFVKALEMPGAGGNTFELGGPDILSWNRMVKTIAAAYGKKKWLVPVPAWGVKSAAFLLDRFFWFPVTGDQITMLMEGNACESGSVFKIFEIEPTPFSVKNLKYLGE